MKQFAILSLLAPWSVLGAIGDVKVTPTHLQAIIEYTPAEAAVCEVEVSEAAGFQPLVPDVDPAMFAGANQDTRPGAVHIAQRRKFVVGQRAVERTLQQIPVSRALQVATLHHFRITCGGDVHTGTFTTKNLPFGSTYGDPIPADPANPGEVLWPHLDYADRSRSYVDPHTGVLLKRLSGPADIIDLGINHAPFPWAATHIRPSQGWTGTSFPYRVSNTTNSLTLMAAGLRGWGGYPFTQATQRYASEVGGHVNWLRIRVTAHSNNAACDSSSGDECRLVACLSTDRLTCHPSSREWEVPFTSTNSTRTFGEASYVNQGGWMRPGQRWLNGPETSNYAGSAQCNGTNTVEGGPFNTAWGPGSSITINNQAYDIAQVRHGGQIVLGGPCPAGNWSFTAQNFSVLLWTKVEQAAEFTVTAVDSQWEFGIPPQWGAAAYWDYSSLTTTPGAGNRPGYLVTMPVFQGMYWVDAENGDSALLNQDGNVNITCLGLAANFDPEDASRWYCVSPTVGSVLSFQYRGNFQERITGPTTGFSFNSINRLPNCNSATNPSNQPCLVQTNLLAGTNIATLVNAFDRAFDATKFASFQPVGINQDGSLVLFSYRGFENTPAWIIVFDPKAVSNTEDGRGCVSQTPGNAGKPGCVRAALPTWLRGAGRGHTMKGDLLPNLAPGWLIYSPMIWSGGSSNGYGPWQMSPSPGFEFRTEIAPGSGFNDLPGGLNTCPPNPLGLTGKRCTQVTVTSEPYDATPGPGETGAPGEYLEIEVGDWLYVNTNNFNAARELLRVVKKDQLTLTLARGQIRGKEACEPGPPVECGAGSTTVQASGPNPLLYLAASSPTVAWHYALDPHGSGAGTHENRFTGRAHSFGRFSSYVESVGGVFDPNCPRTLADGCYGLRFLATPEPDVLQLLQTARTGAVPMNPGFAGKFGFANPNNVQTHPSGMGHNGTPEEREFFLDARPFNGVYTAGTPNIPTASLVAGQLWKFPAIGANRLPLNRKILATKAQIGWRPLRDRSGPGSLLTSDAGDSFTYCVVEAAGECYAGSVPGEVYFNTPFLRFPYCAFPGQAGSGQDDSDVCITNESIVHDGLMQLRLNVRGDVTGSTQRLLSKGFTPSRMGAPFWNIQALSNNKWALFRTRFLNGFRNEAMLLKLPPVNASDSIRRDTFQVALISSHPTRPPGTRTAIVEFGYAENGPAENLFCTSRAQSCAVGRAAQTDQIDLAAPFSFLGTENVAGTPCTSGCTIAVPAIPGRMLYYRMRYRDAGGQEIGVTGLQVVALP